MPHAAACAGFHSVRGVRRPGVHPHVPLGRANTVRDCALCLAGDSAHQPHGRVRGYRQQAELDVHEQRRHQEQPLVSPCLKLSRVCVVSRRRIDIERPPNSTAQSTGYNPSLPQECIANATVFTLLQRRLKSFSSPYWCPTSDRYPPPNHCMNSRAGGSTFSGFFS